MRKGGVFTGHYGIQCVFQELSVVPANVVLTTVNSAPVNAHLHCYIINVINVRILCVLLDQLVKLQAN